VKQCDSYSTSMQVQCCYVEGHSGEHFFSHHDESDRIRWKLAADQRDALQQRLSALEAENERLRAELTEARAYSDLDRARDRRAGMLLVTGSEAIPIIEPGSVLMVTADGEDEDNLSTHELRATGILVEAANRTIERLEAERNTALSDLARVREECELVREAMRQAQQTATRRLDECERMRPVYEAAVQWHGDKCSLSAWNRPTGFDQRLHVAVAAALTPKEP
jgi:uncharacterized small protein (DUF1192 family)